MLVSSLESQKSEKSIDRWRAWTSGLTGEDRACGFLFKKFSRSLGRDCDWFGVNICYYFFWIGEGEPWREEMSWLTKACMYRLFTEDIQWFVCVCWRGREGAHAATSANRQTTDSVNEWFSQTVKQENLSASQGVERWPRALVMAERVQDAWIIGEEQIIIKKIIMVVVSWICLFDQIPFTPKNQAHKRQEAGS